MTFELDSYLNYMDTDIVLSAIQQKMQFSDSIRQKAKTLLGQYDYRNKDIVVYC